MTTLLEAEQEQQRKLRADPQQALGWCMLGEIRLQLGKLAEAEAAYQNALRLEPAIADGHVGLGAVRKEQGRRTEAVLCYRRGLTQAPEHVDALLNLGVLLAEGGQVDEAIGHWRQALSLRPEHAQAHHNLGVALAQKGQLQEAVESLERALTLKPDYAEACYNLANVKQSLVPGLCSGDGQAEVVELYRRAVEIRPGYIEAYHNLGAVLTELGRAPEAAVWLRQAVRLCEGGDHTAQTKDNGRPCHPLTTSCYNQLGLALQTQGAYAEAEACYRAALRRNPAYAEAHSNLGNLFQEKGRLSEALAAYDLALVYEPQSASTHWNRALSWLQAGDFARGWREYEWRWQRKQTPARPFRQPRWDGSSLDGRTLLIYMEQGLGDMLQFIRYAGRVHGGKVVVECPESLVPLFSRCRGVDQVIAEGAPLPEFAVQAPLLSLPALLGTTLETIPAEVPYLVANPELVEKWRAWLEGQQPEGQQPTRVGIVWQGNPRHRLDRYRSIPLAEFAPLARVPGVQLMSLQKGDGAEQLSALGERFSVLQLPENRDATAGAFMDTAAVMQNLDLVIAVDTAAAHLAGGLAVPVWLPLSAVGEWRWLVSRQDSPWYPTLRLFRQKKLGSWRGVFWQMKRELSRRSSYG
jgi:tetratricopeptide (TPR) repeat protein